MSDNVLFSLKDKDFSVTAATTCVNTPVNIQKHDATMFTQNPNPQNTPTCFHPGAFAFSQTAPTPGFTLIKRSRSWPDFFHCTTVKPNWQDQERQSLQYHNSARQAFARKVRTILLRTSSSDSTPSPPRRRVRSYYTHRYRKRLYLYRLLAVQRRQVRHLREAEKEVAQAGQSSADCSFMKGSASDFNMFQRTAENLKTLGLLYQKEKRKRCSSSGPSPPERKKSSRKVKRKLWRQQLNSSSSDSPVSVSSTNASSVFACSFCSSASQSGAISDIRTPSLTGPLNRSPCDQENYSVSTDLCINKKQGLSADQTVPKECSKHGGLKQKKSRMLTEINFLEISSNIKKVAGDSPSGNLQMVKFKNASNTGSSPYVAKMQVSQVGSKSQNEQKLPNTSHVTKPNKKVAEDSKDSAIMVQHKTPNKAIWKSPMDKYSVSPKVSYHVQPLCKKNHSQKLTPRFSNNHPTKKGKDVSKCQSKDTQVLKTQLKFRSENPPTSKTVQVPFKCRSSYVSLDNLKTITPTPVPFRKPDTPRPKSCPEYLKWKKILELRTKTMRLASADVSSKGQSFRKFYSEPSPLSMHEVYPRSENLSEPSDEPNLNSTPIVKSTLKTFHGKKPDCKDGIMKRQGPAQRLVAPSIFGRSAIQADVQNDKVEQQNFKKPLPCSKAKFTPEMPVSTSSQMIGQAIISAVTFIMKVQPESESISMVCYPCAGCESTPFKINEGKQTGTQGASVSRCQYYAVRIEPVEPVETSQEQNTSELIQGGCRESMQGGGDTGTDLSGH